MFDHVVLVVLSPPPLLLLLVEAKVDGIDVVEDVMIVESVVIANYRLELEALMDEPL